MGTTYFTFIILTYIYFKYFPNFKIFLYECIRYTMCTPTYWSAMIMLSSVIIILHDCCKLYFTLLILLQYINRLVIRQVVCIAVKLHQTLQTKADKFIDWKQWAFYKLDSLYFSDKMFFLGKNSLMAYPIYRLYTNFKLSANTRNYIYIYIYIYI